MQQTISNRDMLADIQSFRQKYGFNAIQLTPQDFKFRQDLLEEEVQELREALECKNPEEIVDALIDIIYIALGTLECAEINVNQAWTEVQRANMSKIRGVKPGREQSGGIDVYKPNDWTAPSHQDNHGILPQLLGV